MNRKYFVIVSVIELNNTQENLCQHVINIFVGNFSNEIFAVVFKNISGKESYINLKIIFIYELALIHCKTA